MSLSESTQLETISIGSAGHISYVMATYITKDGEVISKSNHRTTLYPGQDLTGHPLKVAAISAVVWTPEVLAAYQESTAET